MKNLALATFLLLTGTLAGGCADAFVADEAPEVVAPTTKLRHGHLIDRAHRFAPGKGGSGTVGLILGVTGTPLEKQKLLERHKVIERHSYEALFNGVAVAVDAADYAEAMASLDADPEVLWYEPDILVDALPDGSSDNGGSSQIVPWSMQHIGATISSAASGNGSGSINNVVVIVIDTGVSHSDVNVALEIDATTMAPVAEDTDGHGTHIAGIAVGADDADGLVGVAPGAPVVDIKVDDAEGIIDLSTVLMAVEAITLYKLQNPLVPIVVNISLGTDVGTTEYNALDEAIRTSTQVGVTYVISSGNHGVNAATVTPAHVVEAITVGAHNAYNRRAGFSNYGSVVDIHAPGVNIPSLVAGNENGAVALMNGTSMAAAHVTGAAALYLSSHPLASAAQVRNALVGAARSLDGPAPEGTPRKRVWVGGF